MAHFDIKITSDMPCPWCYLGVTRLQKAIDLHKKTVSASDTFTISWNAFCLDPTMPKVGVPMRQHLYPKLGPRMEFMIARLQAMGEADGIRYNNDRYVGNSRDSHRLVQLAKTKSNEMENRVVLALFKAHFEDGGDLTSHDMLLSAAEKAGLDRAEAKRWLDEGKGGDIVDREIETAYRAGIHGVPSFLINGKYRLEGAQDVQVFLEEFAEARASAEKVSQKNYCDADGC